MSMVYSYIRYECVVNIQLIFTNTFKNRTKRLKLDRELVMAVHFCNYHFCSPDNISLVGLLYLQMKLYLLFGGVQK